MHNRDCECVWTSGKCEPAISSFDGNVDVSKTTPENEIFPSGRGTNFATTIPGADPDIANCKVPFESVVNEPCCNQLQPVNGVCPPALAFTSFGAFEEVTRRFQIPFTSLESSDIFAPPAVRIFDLFFLRTELDTVPFLRDPPERLREMNLSQRAIIRTTIEPSVVPRLNDEANFLRSADVGQLSWAMCGCNAFGDTMLVHHIALANLSMLLPESEITSHVDTTQIIDTRVVTRFIVGYK